MPSGAEGDAAGPIKTVEPVDPVEPTTPVEPVEPTTTVEPVDPNDLVDRFAPIAHASRPGSRRGAVVCLAPTSPRAAVRSAVESAGFVVVADVERGLEAVGAAGEHAAAVVVLDLTLVGMLGLRLIPVLKAAAPGAKVVALSPFDTLDAAVLNAGADAVVPSGDLGKLRRVLEGFGGFGA